MLAKKEESNFNENLVKFNIIAFMYWFCTQDKFKDEHSSGIAELRDILKTFSGDTLWKNIQSFIEIKRVHKLAIDRTALKFYKIMKAYDLESLDLEQSTSLLRCLKNKFPMFQLIFPEIQWVCTNNFLSKAAEEGDLETVELFLKQEDFNDIRFALSGACLGNQTDLVRILLDYVTPTITSCSKWAYKSQCIVADLWETNCEIIIDMFLKHPAFVFSTKNKIEGCQKACEKGNKAILERLLQEPDICPEVNNNELLKLATIKGQEDLKAFLLSYPKVKLLHFIDTNPSLKEFFSPEENGTAILLLSHNFFKLENKHDNGKDKDKLETSIDSYAP